MKGKLIKTGDRYILYDEDGCLILKRIDDE